MGIPTIHDRCLQARVKNALEPFWEARFEGSSYGFRPGRSQQDAIEKIFNIARPNKRKKWVLDADIKGAFDNIDHNLLLKTIGNFPARELIQQWLKAGYVDKNVFHDTDKGTPQGGVISPLLANIALHGMEQALGVYFNSRGDLVSPRAMVRYADDFVVFCETKEDAEKIRDEILPAWLEERGLTLSVEKTRIVHLTEGFDFLGFNIRHYHAPKTTRSGYKLLIKPSAESVKRIREKLKKEWYKARGHGLRKLIPRLNPIIRGWANYFRTQVSKETFSRIDHWMYLRECRYARYTHKEKSNRWKMQKYWGALNSKRPGDHWVFGDKQTGSYLWKFSWTENQRHVLVKGTASPDNPDLKEYWENRIKAKTEGLYSLKWQRISRRQGGKCPVCKEDLKNGEELQQHHLDPKGGDYESNLKIVHLLCHQQLTAEQWKSGALKRSGKVT